MKRKKEHNKFCKLFFLLLFLFQGINSFAQYSIKDEGSTLTKKEMASLQSMIDYQLEFYNRVFPDSVMEKTSVRLSVFNDYIDYLVYRKEQSGYINPNSMGYYSSERKEVVACKEKNEAYFLNTCYHELSHFFLMSNMATPPVWLNEGLAEYFGETKMSEPIEHKSNLWRRARVKTMIQLGDINLRDFIDWSPNRFNDTSFTQTFYGYALAYCMVFFLMQNEETMISIISSVYKGKSSYEALDNAYEGGFEAFEKEFISSMGKLGELKINPEFVYALPVKPGDSIRFTVQRSHIDFTLHFDLSSAGDTIYASREGRVSEESAPKGDPLNNRIIIRHKDDSYSGYTQYEKSLVYQGKYVRLGEPIAVNTGKTVPKKINFGVYYMDRNRNRYSHIIPVFHTRNAGDIRLEENVVYIGDINGSLTTQEWREKEKRKNKKKGK